MICQKLVRFFAVFREITVTSSNIKYIYLPYLFTQRTMIYAVYVPRYFLNDKILKLDFLLGLDPVWLESHA